MKHNFGAGPCILPQQVFKEASEAVLNFNGLSILEVSHRHKDFVAVMEETIDLVKKALNVPQGYSVGFLQGGASLGFTISALNMMRSNKKAGYLDTGTWSSKAIKEAAGIGMDVHVLASSKDKNYSYIPKGYDIPQDIDYLHFTSNNTIFGTQYKATPNTNAQSVKSNTERLQKLLERAHIAENEANDLVTRVEDDTKGILELGDQIAKRRERIQADRERVVANQRRTADQIIKLK